MECNKILSDSTHFCKHWLVKHKTDAYNCINCKLKFYCITDLALHDYVDHNLIGLFHLSKEIFC